MGDDLCMHIISAHTGRGNFFVTLLLRLKTFFPDSPYGFITYNVD